MSPTSRKRKKPARRSESRVDALATEVVASYRDTLEAGGFDVELYTSELLGTWWQRAVTTGTDPDVVPVAVIRCAARQRGTEALAALLALAHLGTGERVREAAGNAATRLSDAGVAAPGWAGDLGPAALERCATVTDVYGDQTTAVCAYQRDGHRHALVALVDHDELGGEIVDAWFSADPDALFTEVAEQAAGTDGIASFADAEPAAVADLLRTGFALLDGAGETPDSEEFTLFRALALARLRSMPGASDVVVLPLGEPAGTPVPDGAGPEPVEVDAAVAGFLGSADAAGVAAAGYGADPVSAAARLIAGFGADEDDRPLRIGPGRLDRLLHSEIPAGSLDDEGRAAFPAVAVAWTRYAARLADLPAAAVADLVGIATECGNHVNEDDHDHGHHEDDVDELLDRYYPELDEAGETDPDVIADLLERRTFAIPETGVEMDGEELDLDPADPDQRRLLVLAEHPEHDEDDPESRRHLAVHEVVAEQLWHDEPPEVWQAARRLRDAGVDRMAALHALGDVAARHLPEAGADPSRYAADLDAVGR